MAFDLYSGRYVSDPGLEEATQIDRVQQDLIFHHEKRRKEAMEYQDFLILTDPTEAERQQEDTFF